MSTVLAAGTAGLALVVAILAALLALVVFNLAVLPRLSRYTPAGAGPGSWPRVSVLVPARDEAANIAACLGGLLAQTYPNLEILVLDDDSHDDTAAIVAGLAAAAPRLRLIRGGMLPPGWLGKANACRQLAEQSSGALLLFTDADVRFAPDLVARAVAAQAALNADLLSIFPRQITVTWAERLAVPLLQHWAVFTLLPLPLLRRSRAPAFAAANGEFLLFRRAAYIATGGHAAVRAAVLEDVGLARAMKALGFHVALADGEDRIWCRMYDDAAAVQAGFAKNLFAFFGGSRRNLAAGLALAAMLWVLPLPAAVLGLALWPAGAPVAALGLVAYGLAVAGRLLLAGRFGGQLGDAFLHPLAVAYVGGIAVQSARLAARGGATWKGRTLGPPRSRRRSG